jgi:hypothetical protein
MKIKRRWLGVVPSSIVPQRGERREQEKEKGKKKKNKEGEENPRRG